jgi:hypothetical protein
MLQFLYINTESVIYIARFLSFVKQNFCLLPDCSEKGFSGGWRLRRVPK